MYSKPPSLAELPRQNLATPPSRSPAEDPAVLPVTSPRRRVDLNRLSVVTTRAAAVPLVVPRSPMLCAVAAPPTAVHQPTLLLPISAWRAAGTPAAGVAVGR